MRHLIIAILMLKINHGVANNTVTITPEKIKIESLAAKRDSASAAESVIQKAFQSGDIDVIVGCFSVLGHYGKFFEMVDSADPPVFKKQLILSLLEQPWRDDLDANGLPPIGSRAYPILQAICIRAMSPYLPDEHLDAKNMASLDRMDDRKERIRLAARFRAALEASGELPKSPDPKPSASDAPPKAVGGPTKQWPWWTAGILLLSSLAIYLKRSPKSKN